MRTVKRGEVYRHFKGGVYEIVGIARHSENPNEEFVVYQPIDHKTTGSELWIRPKEMFLEKIERDGKTVLRFKKTTSPHNP